MTSRAVVRTLLVEVDPDPDQVRREFPEAGLQELARSLSAGQLHPLLVYRNSGTGRLTILDGERRYRAASLAGIEALDVIVVSEPSGTGSRLQQQLVAGIHSEALPPVARAQGIARLMKENGWNAKQVSEALGLSPATVSRDLKVGALAPEILERVSSGEITPAAAYQLAQAESKEVQAALADRAARGELTRDQVAREVRRARVPAREPLASSVRRATVCLGSGRQVTLVAEGALTLDLVVELVEELLGKARKFRNRGGDLATFVAQAKLDARSPSRPAGEVQP